MYRYSSSDGRPRVIKLLLGSYPATLHTELAEKGLMPKLLVDPVTYPGGYTMVEMEYLDLSDGWSSLQFFRGQVDPDQVQRAFDHALRGLQECLGGKAVHGDLRAPNIMVRYVLFAYNLCTAIDQNKSYGLPPHYSRFGLAMCC